MIANLLGSDGLYVIVIALIVLVGGSQLPKIARNVGLAGKEFRNAQAEAEEEAKKAKQSTPAAALPPPVEAAPVATPPAAPVATAAPAAQPAGDPAITLTPAQLDALLKAREDQVRNESSN